MTYLSRGSTAQPSHRTFVDMPSQTRHDSIVNVEMQSFLASKKVQRDSVDMLLDEFAILFPCICPTRPLIPSTVARSSTGSVHHAIQCLVCSIYQTRVHSKNDNHAVCLFLAFCVTNGTE